MSSPNTWPPPPEDRVVIRCAIPDCEWGYPISDTGQMGKCYRAHRKHSEEVHGLAADDDGALFHYNLEKHLLTYLSKK
jgi:hypothetical protein